MVNEFPDCAKCQRLYDKWVAEDYPQAGKDYDDLGKPYELGWGKKHALGMLLICASIIIILVTIAYVFQHFK